MSRLDSLRVITPCTVAWASMTGDDAVRFCDQCRKNVYNVAALSHAEAVALIERAEGRVCMQLTRRSDGTIVTGDCWAQIRRARKRGLLALAAALPVILAVQLWSQGFGLRALRGILFHPRPVLGAMQMRGEATTTPPRPDPIKDLDPVLKGKIATDDSIPQSPPFPPRRKKHLRRSFESFTMTVGAMAVVDKRPKP